MICTVGISLKRGVKDGLEFGSSEMIQWMLSLSPEDRELGAEINSIASILKLNKFDFERNKLIFMVSDTEMGEKVGGILKEYFQKQKDLKFNDIEVVRIEGLDDQKPIEFKRKGLRNLVRELGKKIKEYGNRLIINATGGFKAQIAFALAIGQAVGVPVFYMFERFPQIIELPPLPLSLDSKFLLENYDMFKELKINGELEKEEFEDIFNKSYSNLPEKLKLLLDIETIDGKKYISLNPMGEVFTEALYIEFMEREKYMNLPDSNIPPNKKLHSKKSDHSVAFIEKYRSIIDKICEPSFVKAVYVKSYSQKYHRKRVAFRLFGDKIEGSFSNKGGSITFEVLTTASNDREREFAVYKLNKIFEDF
jgi:putative CRISPR-associated protein (TIGR02619 family)